MVSIEDYKEGLNKLFSQNFFIIACDNQGMVNVLKNYAKNAGFYVEDIKRSKNAEYYKLINETLLPKKILNSEIHLPERLFDVMKDIDRKHFFLNDEMLHKLLEKRTKNKFNKTLDEFLNTLNDEEKKDYDFELNLFVNQCYHPNNGLNYFFDGLEIKSDISMLETLAYMVLLNPKPHDKILEIGTYSGYNSALLVQMGCELDTLQTHEGNLENVVQDNLTNIIDLNKINFLGSLNEVKDKKYDKIFCKEVSEVQEINNYCNLLKEGGKYVGLMKSDFGKKIVIAKNNIIEPFYTLK